MGTACKQCVVETVGRWDVGPLMPSTNLFCSSAGVAHTNTPFAKHTQLTETCAVLRMPCHGAGHLVDGH